MRTGGPAANLRWPPIELEVDAKSDISVLEGLLWYWCWWLYIWFCTFYRDLSKQHSWGRSLSASCLPHVPSPLLQNALSANMNRLQPRISKSLTNHPNHQGHYTMIWLHLLLWTKQTQTTNQTKSNNTDRTGNQTKNKKRPLRLATCFAVWQPHKASERWPWRDVGLDKYSKTSTWTSPKGLWVLKNPKISPKDCKSQQGRAQPQPFLKTQESSGPFLTNQALTNQQELLTSIAPPGSPGGRERTDHGLARKEGPLSREQLFVGRKTTTKREKHDFTCFFFMATWEMVSFLDIFFAVVFCLMMFKAKGRRSGCSCFPNGGKDTKQLLWKVSLLCSMGIYS